MNPTKDDMFLYHETIKLFDMANVALRGRSAFVNGIQEAMRSAMLFKIDNIATWTYEHILPPIDSNETYELKEAFKQIPVIAPIADAMWFEYETIPERNLSKNKQTTGSHQGALVLVLYDAERGPVFDRFVPQVSKEDKDYRWLVTFFDFLYSTEEPKGVWTPDYIHLFQIDAQGRYVRGNVTDSPLTSKPKQAQPVVSEEIMTSLSALCFMHAKNVVAVDHVPPRAERRRMEKLGQAIKTYKTLDIEVPAKKLKSTMKRNPGVSAFAAMHLVRGHFAQYTPENPLFGKPGGKREGLVYVPAHARGKKEKGTIDKTYNLKLATDKSK